jgi:hypothetical protein
MWRQHDPIMISRRRLGRKVAWWLLVDLLDLGLTEGAHGPQVINAGGEDLFWSLEADRK